MVMVSKAVGARNSVGLHKEVVLGGHHATNSDQHEGKEGKGVHLMNLNWV